MIDAYGNLKLGDFGWSIKTNGKRKTLCGTPEVFFLNLLLFTTDVSLLECFRYF
jgi:hypothetical protein